MDKDILKGIADNPMLFDAVKNAVLKHFELDLTFRPEVSNENLGEVTRAILEGRKRIEDAFADIARCKSTQQRRDDRMPAR